MNPASSAPRLSDEQLPEIIELIKEADIVELSTKCDPGEAFQAAAEVRAFLTGRGVDLTGDQEAKTAKALEFFAARLGAGALPAGGPAEVADDQ